eukprot:CAMPEP_0180671546 /NCGR_PEP_ID=MMETSP1037_2-20121125/64636_1 /TAXON_ID=632150 /ORGANISM="Azadinium spinosum, Strain 3D9" /LENGTH=173 /DNA_ID=CAMNT_0022700589 /DNA_START=23 /DNA_END=540 /DNA_ORIENTATION=+
MALQMGLLVMSAALGCAAAERDARMAVAKPAHPEHLMHRLELGGGNLPGLPDWRSCSSSELVPGDAVLLGTGQVPCDVALLQGHCLVDEALLTGEALPVEKNALPDDDCERPSSQPEFRKHYLFAGSRIIDILSSAGVDEASVEEVASSASFGVSASSRSRGRLVGIVVATAG